jgi:hypothetical protein
MDPAHPLSKERRNLFLMREGYFEKINNSNRNLNLPIFARRRSKSLGLISGFSNFYGNTLEPII